jgi:hypothetical protein
VAQTGKAVDLPFEAEVTDALRELGHAVEPQVGTAGYSSTWPSETQSGLGACWPWRDGAAHHARGLRAIGTACAKACWRAWAGPPSGAPTGANPAGGIRSGGRSYPRSLWQALVRSATAAVASSRRANTYRKGLSGAHCSGRNCRPCLRARLPAALHCTEPTTWRWPR